MDIKLSNVKEPRRIELMGMIIITCFNLAFLISALPYVKDGPAFDLRGVWILFLAAEFVWLTILFLLLKLYSARAGIDEMHDVQIENNKTLAILQQLHKDMRELMQATQLERKELVDSIAKLLGSKNLPPL